jgi:hypothetical protein
LEEKGGFMCQSNNNGYGYVCSAAGSSIDVLEIFDVRTQGAKQIIRYSLP